MPRLVFRFLFAGLLIVGSAPPVRADTDRPPAAPAPATATPTEVQGPGFAFQEPQGEGWTLLSPQALQRLDPVYRVGFALSAGVARRAVIGIGSMTLSQPDEPPETVLKAIAPTRHRAATESVSDQAPESARVHVVSSAATMTTRHGATCWREDESAEDRGVPGHEGEVFSLARHRLLCVHPDFAGLLIVADSSLRLGPGETAVGDDAGEAVLQSLTFPALGRRVTTIPLGRGVQGLAATPGAIWVAAGRDDGGVTRIDPQTNRAVVTIPTGRWPVGVAADAGAVWVANTGDDTVSRIDPATNQVVAKIPVGHRPLQIALGGGSVWVSDSGDGSVSRIDPATNKATAMPGVATMPAGIAVAGDAVFVTDYEGDRITRLDAGTGETLGKIESGRQSNVLLTAGDEVWANDPVGHAVLRFRSGAPDQAPDRITAGIGLQPAGLAREGNDLWVANTAEGMLTIINLQEAGQHFRAIPTGRHPFALLAAAGAIWVSNADDGTVLRLDSR